MKTISRKLEVALLVGASFAGAAVGILIAQEKKPVPVITDAQRSAYWRASAERISAQATLDAASKAQEASVNDMAGSCNSVPGYALSLNVAAQGQPLPRPDLKAGEPICQEKPKPETAKDAVKK